MEERAWKQLCTVPSELEAHVTLGVLETHGIPARISMETVERLFGITTGALGGVQIFVPEDLLKQAEEVLATEVPNE